MNGLKLVSYHGANGVRTGIIIDEFVVDVAEITGKSSHTDMIRLIEEWDQVEELLQTAASHQDRRPGTWLASVELLAPVPLPGAVYCAGANYSDHVAEMRGGSAPTAVSDQRAAAQKPWHFVKSSHAVVGPGTAVLLPADAQRVDWEAELAVVIGRKTKNVAIEDALVAVWGYTIANDLSARDLSRRKSLPDASPFYFDWMGHKSFDGSCPLGPWIVSARAIPDPNRLGIRLTINDVEMQNANTGLMIFTVAEQISHLSRNLTLWPGDVILTGTPSGVGAGRNVFLKSADRITISIEGIGHLHHSIA
jgi:2-keto-4-pentenoate hydratase/2-oxohepta-3-ene-1,7-dioic acid hydratase in catechol pathway